MYKDNKRRSLSDKHLAAKVWSRIKSPNDNLGEKTGRLIFRTIRNCINKLGDTFKSNKMQKKNITPDIYPIWNEGAE